MEKVCCGGFYLGEGLELDGRTLKATGGSSPVPDPEVADIGKVLGIVEDGAGAKYAPVEGGGSGLPDPSSLPDGTAMVAVNGEWKMQEGYGYTSPSAFESITWNGDTEGREIIAEAFCKVSDIPMPQSSLTGSKIKVYNNGEIEEYNFSVAQNMGADIYAALYGEMQVLVALADTSLEEIEVHKGVYFMFVEGEGYTDYISELSFAHVVHQFDSALIPASGVEEFTVIFEQEVETLVATADKTVEEIENAWTNGKKIKGYLYQTSETMKIFDSELNMDTGLNFYSVPLFEVDNNLFNVLTLSYNEENWDVATYSYTLTPAT